MGNNPFVPTHYLLQGQILPHCCRESVLQLGSHLLFPDYLQRCPAGTLHTLNDHNQNFCSFPISPGALREDRAILLETITNVALFTTVMPAIVFVR